MTEHREVVAHAFADELERLRNPRQVIVHAHGAAHEHQTGKKSRIARHRRAFVERNEVPCNTAPLEIAGKIARSFTARGSENGDGFHARYYCAGSLPRCGAAAAADVALIGVIGDKAAVLALDGGDPKTVKVGQTWNGITVLSVAKDRATVEIDGRRRVLMHGPHYRAAEGPPSAPQTTLAADERGHFLADGAVNGHHGALPRRYRRHHHRAARARCEAHRPRLPQGRAGLSKTANGTVPVYRVNLDIVKLGDIELHSVEAMVIEQGLDTALLGMSFLNRVEMKRDGSTMTLIRRF